MIKSIRFLSLLIVFLLLSTYYPTYKNDSLSLIFPIKKIKKENNKILEKNELLYELENIKGKNLLLIDDTKIKFTMSKFTSFIFIICYLIYIYSLIT